MAAGNQIEPFHWWPLSNTRFDPDKEYRITGRALQQIECVGHVLYNNVVYLAMQDGMAKAIFECAFEAVEEVDE